jgi:outer membrane protein TolC
MRRQTLFRMNRIKTEALVPMLLLSLSIGGRAQQATPVHLTLDQTIALALKQNHSLQLRELSVKEMHNKKDEAKAAYLPHIKTEASVLHVTELSGIQIPAGAFGSPSSTGPIPSSSLFLGQGALTSYTDGVGLEQPLTQLFRIHQSNVAAGVDIHVAETELEQSQDDVALKARQLYYSVLIAQLQLKSSLDEVESAKVKAAESQSDVERGNALEVVSLQSEAALLSAEQKQLAAKLNLDDSKRQLADLLALPLHTQFDLEPEDASILLSIPSREEAVRIANDSSPELRIARQTVEKAEAGVAAAKDSYIPDITALSRYSYQSGIPFLVHNFGTFGFTLSYDLFDGGSREAKLREAKTELASARVNLERLEEDTAAAVETAYDRVEELQQMVAVAQQAVRVRNEAARLADRQFEQNAALNSARTQAQADISSATASLLQANLGLYLAQADLKRTIGQMPR